MNSWVLVFLMAQGPGENFTEYYKLDTQFESQAECVSFVETPETNAVIKDHLRTVYPIRPVKNVWCMQERAWEKLMSIDNGI